MVKYSFISSKESTDLNNVSEKFNDSQKTIFRNDISLYNKDITDFQRLMLRELHDTDFENKEFAFQFINELTNQLRLNHSKLNLDWFSDFDMTTDESSLIVIWIKEKLRVGVNLEPQKNESFWFISNQVNSRFYSEAGKIDLDFNTAISEIINSISTSYD